eukprot:UN07772
MQTPKITLENRKCFHFCRICSDIPIFFLNWYKTIFEIEVGI